MDAYTPLIELKEKQPPIGYSVFKKDKIMDIASKITKENLRAPVISATCNNELNIDFVANTDDTWLTFIKDLITNAKYKLSIDELGKISFQPDQDTASLQPIFTYTDDNSSILYPDLDMDHDLYGIPNVVEVIYTNAVEDKNTQKYSRVVNDDPNSPTSTVNRGREIIYRVTDPGFIGVPTEGQIDEYANQLLRELSTIEYTITYTHGYCPVRLGDCVRLNYTRAGLTNIKAKVISQSIKCTPGCPVTEKAVFTTKLWR